MTADTNRSDDKTRRQEADVENEHICCTHQTHIMRTGTGCCAPGHAAWVWANPRREGDNDFYDPFHMAQISQITQTDMDR